MSKKVKAESEVPGEARVSPGLTTNHAPGFHGTATCDSGRCGEPTVRRQCCGAWCVVDSFVRGRRSRAGGSHLVFYLLEMAS